MKTTFSKLTLLSLVLTLLFSSCKKDPYEIGYDLLPASDTVNVKTFDTSTIVAYSVLHDSIRTDRRANTLLGSMMDPIFGPTSATWYTQFRITTESLGLDPDTLTNAVLDSVVLQLRYAGIYGDTNTMQRLKIYEINQDMYYDSSYYSNQTVGTYPNLLADYSFVPKPKDSVSVGGKKVTPHIRINLTKLTNYFGNKLLFAPTEVTSSNLSFIKYMKGLAIVSEPVVSGGGFVYISYSDAMTRLIVYYHNSYPGTEKPLQYQINDVCARTNYFNHNGYLTANQDLKNQILNKDTAQGQQRLFVQGLGGVQIKLRLPHIEELKKLGNIAINNARLVIKNYETDTTYKPVPTLYLLKKDSAGRIAFLTDYLEGTAYFGGDYDRSNRTYSFRITRHVQQILLGQTKNYDLYIMASNPASTTLTPNRVTIRGTKPTDPAALGDRVRLEVVYTKIH